MDISAAPRANVIAALVSICARKQSITKGEGRCVTGIEWDVQEQPMVWDRVTIGCTVDIGSCGHFGRVIAIDQWRQ